MFQPEFYGDIMAFYDKWVAVLKNPKETLAAEKPNSSISQGAFHLSIASAILGFFLGMGMWLISNLNFNVTPVDSAGFDKGIGTGLMYAIIGIILAILLPLSLNQHFYSVAVLILLPFIASFIFLSKYSNSSNRK